MTAAVTVEGGRIRAPRGARIRATVGLVYVGLLSGVTMARTMTFTYIVSQGEGAAARAVVTSLVCVLLALLVITIRSARVTVDDDGIRWGWGGIGFRLDRRRIATVKLYTDAAAVKLNRGSIWWLSGRDYTPYLELCASLRLTGLTILEEPRRAPLAARLQAYGVALDVILVLAVFGATAVFLLS
jgi:hypothetical protein